MKRSAKLAAVVAAAAYLAAACDGQREVSLDDLLAAEDMGRFNGLALRAKEQGADGIPLLLAVIDDSLKTKYRVLSYGKLNASISHLRDLAADGFFLVDSVPVLIRAVEAQPAIADALVTAEILQTITGVDVGYDADFVASYRVEDERRRQAVISTWRR